MINIFLQVFLEIKGVQLPDPFPRLTYAEAMSQYGSDRPDTRFDLGLKDVKLVGFHALFVFILYLFQFSQLRAANAVYSPFFSLSQEK